jgi:hypothetical protein
MEKETDELEFLAAPFPLPSWLPPSVAELIDQMKLHLVLVREPLAAHSLLVRLAAAPKMKLVWSEIFKKRRTKSSENRPYLYPARTVNALRREAKSIRRSRQQGWLAKARILEVEANLREDEEDDSLGGREDWDEQNVGARVLFYNAWLGKDKYHPQYIADMSQFEARRDKCNLALSKIATELGELGLVHHARDLWNIWETLHSDDGRFDYFAEKLIFERRGSDDALRAYVSGLGHLTKRLFGTHLFGTIANITSTAFDRTDLNDAFIRGILRDELNSAAD